MFFHSHFHGQYFFSLNMQDTHWKSKQVAINPILEEGDEVVAGNSESQLT